MDSISTARLQLVWPLLADKIKTMADMLETEGILIRVTQGLRSWNEQDDLYAQGRTKPGKIVTNCKGGDSYHNYGMACDLVPSQFGKDQPYSPDWNAQHASWKRMEVVGVSLGLVSGATWRTFPDNPHFQLNGRFPVGAPDDEVKQLFKSGGMIAVWRETGLEAA
jgi:peptidoglycan L-alanyl-D-glutamate endopeptidase CwlK